MSVKARVLRAIDETLARREPLLEAMAGGTLTVLVKLDDAGCPRQVSIRTEVTEPVDRKQLCRVAG